MKQLRCQPGDLAVIVKSSKPGNERYKGQLVEVVAPFNKGHRVDWWEVEPIGFDFPGCATGCLPDDWLKPLKGNPDATTEARTNTEVTA